MVRVEERLGTDGFQTVTEKLTAQDELYIYRQSVAKTVL